MTYKELIEELMKLPTDRLNDDVIVYDRDRDDFCGVNHMSVAINEHNDDAPDPWHTYLILKSCGI